MTINTVTVGIPSGIAGWKLLQGKAPSDFRAFSRDASLQRDLAYLREKLPTKMTAKDLLADRRLQSMVFKAYGLDSQVGYDALMRKVLESNPDDANSTAGRMTDHRYRQISKDLNYGGIVIPEIPAVPSSVTLHIEGVMPGRSLRAVSGSIGGVAIEDVSLEGLDSRQEIAEKIQASFRKADGGREDITARLIGLKIVLTDARGRGEGALRFEADPGSTARAYLVSSTKGRLHVAGQGGPNIGKSELVESIVARYTQSRFEESVGETSDSLRKAIYAKRMLPQVSSWYNVIADRNLAEVVQKAFGLPDSFGRLNVDQQKAQLEKRMPISDFRDAGKLSKLLDRYVASSGSSNAASLISFF